MAFLLVVCLLMAAVFFGCVALNRYTDSDPTYPQMTDVQRKSRTHTTLLAGTVFLLGASILLVAIVVTG